jgi:hypothetical protein
MMRNPLPGRLGPRPHLWPWLFVHATELTEIPADLTNAYTQVDEGTKIFFASAYSPVARVHSECEDVLIMIKNEVAAGMVSTMPMGLASQNCICECQSWVIWEWIWTVSWISWASGSPNRRHTSMQPCTGCSPKVRAMVRVATPANEPLLLEQARLTTAAQLEKLCRKYALVQRHGQDPRPNDDAQRRYVRRRDTEDGMVKIEAVLHPEEAELVWTMLNHAAAQLARQPGAAAHDDSAESKVTPSAPLSAVPQSPVGLRYLHDGRFRGIAGDAGYGGSQ